MIWKTNKVKYMNQYIDKSAVVAEINRVLNSYDPNEITSGRYALVDLRDFINTLEVKEVEKQDNGSYPNLSNQMDGWELGYKDAIEKAFRWLLEQMFELDDGGEIYVADGDASSIKEFLDNFKQAMEEQQ